MLSQSSFDRIGEGLGMRLGIGRVEYCIYSSTLHTSIVSAHLGKKLFREDDRIVLIILQLQSIFHSIASQELTFSMYLPS